MHKNIIVDPRKIRCIYFANILFKVGDIGGRRICNVRVPRNLVFATDVLDFLYVAARLGLRATHRARGARNPSRVIAFAVFSEIRLAFFVKYNPFRWNVIFHEPVHTIKSPSLDNNPYRRFSNLIGESAWVRVVLATIIVVS